MFKKYFHKLLDRPAKSKKTDFGHIFILAGSVGMTGSPILVASAAMRTGAGLTTIGIPKSLNAIVSKRVLEVMTKPLPETKEQTLSLDAYPEIVNFIKKRSPTVLVVGPGLSRNQSTKALIRKIIQNIKLPMVIDADGINALADHLDNLKSAAKTNRDIILTPHEGEFARLTEKTVKEVAAKREKVAKEFAQRYNITVVLKGHQTIVSHPNGKMYKNKTGNPGMATAGAGDVLSGMIAALLAQKIKITLAVELAVYLHGLAGDLAAREKTQAGMIASDIIEEIPRAIKSQ